MPLSTSCQQNDEKSYYSCGNLSILRLLLCTTISLRELLVRRTGEGQQQQQCGRQQCQPQPTVGSNSINNKNCTFRCPHTQKHGNEFFRLPIEIAFKIEDIFLIPMQLF